MIKAIGLIAAAVLSSAALAQSEGKDVWVGQLTGNLQCEPTDHSSLGTAVSQLSNHGVQVREARIGYIEDRMFCVACGCPDGTFNLVKAELNEELQEVLEQGEWEMVKPVNLQDGHGDFRILPVTPFETQ